MKPKFAFAFVTLASLGFASAALAEIDVQALVDELTANGYQVRETYTAQNQLRVEARYQDQRVEMVYDTTTGALISQEASLLRDQDRTQDRLQDGSNEDGPDQDRTRDHDGAGSDDSGSDDHGRDGAGHDANDD